MTHKVNSSMEEALMKSREKERRGEVGHDMLSNQ
jgi:hypothetical protein